MLRSRCNACMPLGVARAPFSAGPGVLGAPLPGRRSTLVAGALVAVSAAMAWWAAVLRVRASRRLWRAVGKGAGAHMALLSRCGHRMLTMHQNVDHARGFQDMHRHHRCDNLQ